MHELSLATSIVAVACDALRRAGGGRVAVVHLRLGVLASVHEDALRFAFEIVRVDTPLAAASLCCEQVPVRIWCGDCRAERTLPDLRRFACPVCGRPSGEVRAGRELEIESLDILSAETEAAAAQPAAPLEAGP